MCKQCIPASLFSSPAREPGNEVNVAGSYVCVFYSNTCSTFWTIGGHLYIVMELLEGAPLSEHITSLKVREGEGGKKREEE